MRAEKDRQVSDNLRGTLDKILGAFETGTDSEMRHSLVESLRSSLNATLEKRDRISLRVFIANGKDGLTACVIDIERSAGMEVTRKADGKLFVVTAFKPGANTCVLESVDGEKETTNVCPALMSDHYDFQRDTFFVRKES